VFAGSHGAGDSGAFGHFCTRNSRSVGVIDDSIFLLRWATRIPGVNHVRVVAGLRDRLGALSGIDQTVVVTC
jgi:hypothetical protein